MKKNQLPSEQDPKLRQDIIDDLQIQLGYCAENYRASSGAKQEKDSLDEYYRVFRELIRITGEIIALDPDSELPDDEMPKEYVDFWL